MNKMVGIISDVLKHTSVLFFHGTVKLCFYRNKLLHIYSNATSLNVWESRQVCCLVSVFFILVTMTLEACNMENI
jgi:hypothetical protein